MANFDFDVTVEQLRRKRGVKWNKYGPDALGAWVADMDFPVAEPIQRALTRAVEMNDLGYSFKSKEGPIPELFAERAMRRYGWRVAPNLVEGMCDVVQGLYVTIANFSAPGASVVTLTPVYPPFLNAVRENERYLIEHELRPQDDYRLDLERLGRDIRADTELLLLCNPHNPTGRVFLRDELVGIAELAERHDLTVLADEIHADLVYSGHQHIPFATLSPETAARTITMTSATKSYNIAGLRYAVAAFGSEALAARYNQIPERLRGGMNSFGVLATEAAWSECDDWLDALVVYLEANRDFALDTIRRDFPGVNLKSPEATFLMWLNCGGLNLPPDPHRFFLERAGVGLSDGIDFGRGGAGHVRLNFATSRQVLERILGQMGEALAARNER
ncbi:MAG: PatB family C-S lyase [Pseudomonadota bacterium]